MYKNGNDNLGKWGVPHVFHLLRDML